MRLIDGDALKQECMYIDDIPAVTERDIHNAPTIHAIPVEWLKQKRDSQNDPWDYLANAIDYILAVYKKEQEAR